MKKFLIFLFILLVGILLMGCNGSTPEPAPTLAPTTPPATEVPVEEPTVQPEPTESVDEMADDGEGAVAGALWANPWQWVSFTNPVEQFEVEMPESYLLTFNEDGTLNVVADCNNVLGSYTDDAGALTLEFGPMTLVACPADSRSDQFVQLLTGAARYFFEDSNLYIDLFADGGTLMFDLVPQE